jgi:hypothetical protein
MIEHDEILSGLMAIIEKMNANGAGLSNFNPGSGAAMGLDPGGQVNLLYGKLKKGLEQTADIQARKPGTLNDILPISPSEGF